MDITTTVDFTSIQKFLQMRLDVKSTQHCHVLSNSSLGGQDLGSGRLCSGTSGELTGTGFPKNTSRPMSCKVKTGDYKQTSEWKEGSVSVM